MTCEQIENLLPGLLFEELDPSQADAVREHLATCPTCETKRAEMDTAARLLSEGLAAEPVLELTAERKAELWKQAAEPVTALDGADASTNTTAAAPMRAGSRFLNFVDRWFGPQSDPVFVRRRNMTWIGAIAAAVSVVAVGLFMSSAMRPQAAMQNAVAERSKGDWDNEKKALAQGEHNYYFRQQTVPQQSKPQMSLASPEPQDGLKKESAPHGMSLDDLFGAHDESRTEAAGESGGGGGGSSRSGRMGGKKGSEADSYEVNGIAKPQPEHGQPGPAGAGVQATDGTSRQGKAIEGWSSNQLADQKRISPPPEEKLALTDKPVGGEGIRTTDTRLQDEVNAEISRNKGIQITDGRARLGMDSEKTGAMNGALKTEFDARRSEMSAKNASPPATTAPPDSTVKPVDLPLLERTDERFNRNVNSQAEVVSDRGVGAGDKEVRNSKPGASGASDVSEKSNAVNTSLGQTANEPINIKQQAAVSEYRQLTKRAEELRQSGQYNGAAEAANQAKIVLDRNAQNLPKDEYTKKRIETDTLSAEIANEGRSATEQQLAATAETREKEAKSRRQDALQSRDAEVQRLLKRAWELRLEEKYDQALELTNQAIYLDPQNVPAEAMKHMMEDSRNYVAVKDMLRKRNLITSDTSVDNLDATMPYNKILNPEDSPEVVQRRLRGLATTQPGLIAETNKKVAGKLAEKIPVNFQANKLVNVVEYLRNTTGASMFVNWNALQQIGIEQDAPITLQLGDSVPADKALKLVLQQVSTGDQSNPMSYAIIDGVVTISTMEDLGKAANPQPAAKNAAEKKTADPVDESPLPAAATFKAGPVNPWTLSERDHLSTFSTDVDTASYTLARNFIRRGYRPPPASVRMEEYVNAFDYNYPRNQIGTDAGGEEAVFGVYSDAGLWPFPDAQGGRAAGLATARTTLLKIGVRGKVIGRDGKKPANLVFVIDASGSMAKEDRLPLIQSGIEMMLEQLAPTDRVSLVIFSNQAQLVLEATPADQKKKILDAVRAIRCQASTNLLDGLNLGYQLAQRNFAADRVNHIVLCTDGVANIGPDQAEEVLSQVAKNRKQGISMTSIGVGGGAYNDQMLEKLANRGDGSYVFVDSAAEAKHVFVDVLTASMQVIAFDAKIQVDFDAKRVRRFRLIGYENRVLAHKDFRNDAVDAGEVGSGQSSTALYEVELFDADEKDKKEQPDIGTVFVRYRDAATGKVREISHRLTGATLRRKNSDARFQLAACAARFAEMLRQSEHAANGDFAQIERMLTEVCKQLPLDARAQELLGMVRKVKGLPAAP